MRRSTIGLAVFSFLFTTTFHGFLHADDALTPLDLRDVQVGGELGRRIDVTVRNNLLVLDADGDFLPPFHKKTKKDGYVGLGKLLDATVRFAAYTGDPKVLALKNHLIGETIGAQEPDGYIGIMAPEYRISGMWDVHEVGYVIWGLLTDYRYFEQQDSLKAARRAADYVVKHWSKIPANWAQQTSVATHVAVTGIERTMLELYRVTGERAYLDFVVHQRTLPEWDLGIVIGRRPGIEGHVYAYMTRCLAQLELYRIEPDARLLQQTERALDFMTHHDGCLITGGTGQCEIWTGDQDGRGELGETCATAYQVRVYDSLLRLRGDSSYGDLMERTIHNALFAAQSPGGRQLRYFSPVEGPRVYWKGDTYCCPCNYRRIVAELPTMVFYRAGRGLAVNLYAPAEAKLEVAGDVPIAVRQETEYPNSGLVRLHLDPEQPARFPVRLRIPAWADGASVKVNDQSVKEPVAVAKFFEIERTWKKGDQVVLDFPMKWRLVRGRQRQAGRVAVMRGPLVFCLNPTSHAELAEMDGADLGYITLDPSSLGKPVPSNAVHPGGIACRVKAWKPGFSLARQGDLELTLTEFPDPNGRATYFRLRDDSVAVDDELFAQTK